MHPPWYGVYPELHDAMAQIPVEHVGVPLATVQTVPQEPQLLMLARTFVSQPFAGFPSQFAVPGRHEMGGFTVGGIGGVIGGPGTAGGPLGGVIGAAAAALAPLRKAGAAWFPGIGPQPAAKTSAHTCPRARISYPRKRTDRTRVADRPASDDASLDR